MNVAAMRRVVVRMRRELLESSLKCSFIIYDTRPLTESTACYWTLVSFSSDDKPNTGYDSLYSFYDIHQAMHVVQLLEWTSLILTQIYA